jgi:hypothetical protein
MNMNKPSVEGLQEYLKGWETAAPFVYSENAIVKLFTKTYPKNTDVSDVLAKVCLLNTIYGTNILKPVTVAEHIVTLNIDPRLESTDLDLVNDIALVTFEGGKKRNFYSFATKFCSFHKPNYYPIFDSYIEKLLWYFNQKDDHFYAYKRDEVRNYQTFYKIITAFRKHFGLAGYSFKETDLYLWQLGKEYFPVNWKKKTLN